VGEAAREANYGLIAIAVLLIGVTLILRAFRWRVLFHPYRDMRIWHLFGSLNVAYLINNVVPFQLGDIGRAYLLSELEGISATRSLSTVVIERIIDVLTLLALLLVIAPFVDIPGWARTPSVLLALGVGALAVVLVLASHRRETVMRIVDRSLRVLPARFRPKLREMASSALDGFGVLSHPRTTLELVAWSVAVWLSVGLIVYAGTEAFGLGIGFGGSLFLLIVTTFGFFVPSSPGSFGVYHAVVIGTLTNVFDIPKTDAVSYALVIHLVFYIPPMLLGLLFLWVERRLWQRTSFFEKLRQFQGHAGELPPAAAPEQPIDGRA
jgi:uncharacterized protein (TIRG00374 family)